jgi:hypothetical protein
VPDRHPDATQTDVGSRTQLAAEATCPDAERSVGEADIAPGDAVLTLRHFDVEWAGDGECWVQAGLR